MWCVCTQWSVHLSLALWLRAHHITSSIQALVPSYSRLPCCPRSALFLCRCLSVGTYVPGPGFIRSVVAPRSPWLVITQTCDVTALSQNLNTWGPHGLTWTSSHFHTCHINAQTDKLCMQEKTLTDRWVHANIKTHTSSCTYTDSSQGPCLCYKNIHWTESLLSSP